MSKDSQMASVSAVRRQTVKPPAIAKPSTNGDGKDLANLESNAQKLRLTVDYRTQHCSIALCRAGHLLLSGPLDCRVTLDGSPLLATTGWEQTCWVSDEDVDYLELEIELTAGLRIQRHFVLARDDEFLFVADAVLGERPARLVYDATLPLADEIAHQVAAETREVQLLYRGRRQAMVLPLALGEWRSDRRGGNLAGQSAALALTQSAFESRSLFAPWFIDLAPRRLSRPVTWRQLTVAEDREVQRPDMAVGYRVQVGTRQWLFYRSLGPCGNRTVLGHNLVSEFLAARFSRQGVPETLIEIEATAMDDTANGDE